MIMDAVKRKEEGIARGQEKKMVFETAEDRHETVE